VEYKGTKLDCGFRVDLLVDNKIIVELKSIDRILPIHEAQLLTYMKLADVSIGLLMNFNVKYMKDGIKRMVL
jgi:GxxExxY protein